MFWSRNSEKSRPVGPARTETITTIDVPPPEDAGSREFELAVETVGAILRTFGQGAFDLDDAPAKELTQRAERWASHVILRSAPPDVEDDRRNLGRDWTGVRQFFKKHRLAEQVYVTKAISDARQVISAFVQSLGRAVVDENGLEARTRTQLDRLRSTVQKSSLEEIKREALSAVGELDSLIETRKKQQRQRADDLATKLQQLGAKLEEAEREVGIDPLTQIANRKVFDSELTKAANVFHVLRQPSGLLIIDVDFFKKVNDTYGHPAGDRVLQALAHAMVLAFPRKTDCVARIGGEEFAVVLRDSRLADVKRLGLRLIDTVRGLSIPVEGAELHITVSVGAAEILEGETPDLWLARADRALYAAKSGGRNRLVEAKADDPTQQLTSRDLTRDLTR